MQMAVRDWNDEGAEDLEVHREASKYIQIAWRLNSTGSPLCRETLGASPFRALLLPVPPAVSVGLALSRWKISNMIPEAVSAVGLTSPILKLMETQKKKRKKKSNLLLADEVTRELCKL